MSYYPEPHSHMRYNLEKKIPHATTLIHVNQYNADKQNLEKKKLEELINNVRQINVRLVSTTVLNTKIGEFKSKILYTSGLVTTNILHTKIEEVGKKIPDHAKYITTPEFNKLTAENFAARLK